MGSHAFMLLYSRQIEQQLATTSGNTTNSAAFWLAPEAPGLCLSHRSESFTRKSVHSSSSEALGDPGPPLLLPLVPGWARPIGSCRPGFVRLCRSVFCSQQLNSATTPPQPTTFNRAPPAAPFPHVADIASVREGPGQQACRSRSRPSMASGSCAACGRFSSGMR